MQLDVTELLLSIGATQLDIGGWNNAFGYSNLYPAALLYLSIHFCISLAMTDRWLSKRPSRFRVFAKTISQSSANHMALCIPKIIDDRWWKGISAGAGPLCPLPRSSVKPEGKNVSTSSQHMTSSTTMSHSRTAPCYVQLGPFITQGGAGFPARQHIVNPPDDFYTAPEKCECPVYRPEGRALEGTLMSRKTIIIEECPESLALSIELMSWWRSDSIELMLWIASCL